LDVDSFAPRLSFFFDVHNDLFAEVAKLRAARRIWAHVMRDRFRAQDDRSLKLRMHCQTAGVTLTEQQPMNNIVRVAYQALAAVLGGTQSLHTNSMDETLALPTEEAAKLALRTQQILAYETNVTQTVDPLAGSYFVETITNHMESEILRILTEIETMGGVLPAIERGYFRRRIAESAFAEQRRVDAGEVKVVGVTDFVEQTPARIDTLTIQPAAEADQVSRLRRLRSSRDPALHAAALAQLRSDAANNRNVMPALIEAAKADATLGEMVESLRSVFGTYEGGPEW
jgi:methylmalonyl-CoA mutase N-terminal domain/subunit